jgi:hypothetical protein
LEQREPRRYAVRYLENPLRGSDGRLTAWLAAPFLTIRQHTDKQSNRTVKDAEASLMYDDRYLYVAARVLDDSPMTNSASGDDPDQWRRAFKHGDALDVQLGLDAKADPSRREPGPGDLRLLITRLAGRAKPAIVLYRYVVPGTPPERRVRFQSPIAETWVAEVRELNGADVFLDCERGLWRLEARVPWESLGVSAPASSARLRGDVGVLWSDPQGLVTVDRDYWSSKTRTMVSDLALEAGVIPALWGELVLEDPAAASMGE